jgi:hypothetical protein
MTITVLLMTILTGQRQSRQHSSLGVFINSVTWAWTSIHNSVCMSAFTPEETLEARSPGLKRCSPRLI